MNPAQGRVLFRRLEPPEPVGTRLGSNRKTVESLYPCGFRDLEPMEPPEPEKMKGGRKSAFSAPLSFRNPEQRRENFSPSKVATT
jgi:hypothetical protein